MKPDLTICYVVGGEERHFRNLEKSVRSLERLQPWSENYKPNLLITQFGDCPIPNFYKDLPNTFNSLKLIEKESLFGLGRFTDHLIWKEKYVTALQSKTRFTVYLDTDIVLAHDTSPIQKPNYPIISTQHFWVPTFNSFLKNVNPLDPVKFMNCCDALGINNNFKIAAGGIFILDNDYKIGQEVLKKTLELHDKVYPDTHCDYVHGLTDEVIFSYVLSMIKGYEFANGALNHCCMEQMPLIQQEDMMLYGKNPFDKNYEIVTALHCDTFRRDPSAPYQQNVKECIQKMFYMKG